MSKRDYYEVLGKLAQMRNSKK
ncbi:hypothetical protein CGLO_17745 [Colletotrichum gloeosporioides Cg-14]|uniref:Uncharacterized protein n=1 Tax=Colletotrichum gloeosporioides (strain Cg-14) TaxID=1237896 RepID=T0L5N6_COLGC|nr:hypothetical protein CGLO_17745 [Colletotrichum gloeosporioides Cg-14]